MKDHREIVLNLKNVVLVMLYILLTIKRLTCLFSNLRYAANNDNEYLAVILRTINYSRHPEAKIRLYSIGTLSRSIINVE